MKLIDEKGRLFGKINIIDFFMAVLIIILIPVFFHVYKILGKTPIRVPNKWIKVEAVSFTLPEVISLMKPGDLTVDEFQNVDGKLLRILKEDPEYGQKIKSAAKQPGVDNVVPVFLELELLCAKSDKSNPWYFRRNPLIVGLCESDTFHFYTTTYRLKCYTMKVKEQ